MEWIAALISVFGAYFVARFAANKEKEKLREELKLEYSIETAIVQLLSEQGWDKRSFKAIKSHIRGFDDDTLRQHLVRAGAVAFESSNEHSDQAELEQWGLLEKNKIYLAKAD